RRRAAEPRARPDGRAGEPPPAARALARRVGRMGGRWTRRQRQHGDDAGARSAGGALRPGSADRMTALLEMLQPDFLLRDAVVCPLVGVYFVLRRMICLGVALPQLSAAGIAFAFLVYRTAMGAHEHGALPEHLLALGGSFLFTLVGILVLATLERQGRATLEA